MLCSCKYLWFIFFDPKNFRRGESRQSDIAGDMNELLFANRLMDLITLTLRALIIPKDRGTKNVPLFVEQDKPMHLTRQADRFDSFSADACFFQNRADTHSHRFPPLLRILFGPQWFWDLQRMR